MLPGVYNSYILGSIFQKHKCWIMKWTCKSRFSGCDSCWLCLLSWSQRTLFIHGQHKYVSTKIESYFSD